MLCHRTFFFSWPLSFAACSGFALSQAVEGLLIFDLNAALGKDAGGVVVRSLGARCLGGGTVWVCLCVRESEVSGWSG